MLRLFGAMGYTHAVWLIGSRVLGEDA